MASKIFWNLKISPDYKFGACLFKKCSQKRCFNNKYICRFIYWNQLGEFGQKLFSMQIVQLAVKRSQKTDVSDLDLENIEISNLFSRNFEIFLYVFSCFTCRGGEVFTSNNIKMFYGAHGATITSKCFTVYGAYGATKFLSCRRNWVHNLWSRELCWKKKQGSHHRRLLFYFCFCFLHEHFHYQVK